MKGNEYKYIASNPIISETFSIPFIYKPTNYQNIEYSEIHFINSRPYLFLLNNKKKILCYDPLKESQYIFFIFFRVSVTFKQYNSALLNIDVYYLYLVSIIS